MSAHMFALSLYVSCSQADIATCAMTRSAGSIPHIHVLHYLFLCHSALQFGLVHISAGDLLRAEVAAGTPAGKEAASYMDSGNLVPNSVVVEMVVNRLEQPDVQEHGWLLDGYPRSGDQAEAIVQKGIKPDLFVLISVRLLAMLTHLFRACSGPSGSAVQTGLVWCM